MQLICLRTTTQSHNVRKDEFIACGPHRFANTPEAQHFLVQGTPTSLGPLHRHLAAQWAFKLHTATSIQTGVPQAHLDFAQASPEALEAFLRRINVSTVAAAQEVGAQGGWR